MSDSSKQIKTGAVLSYASIILTNIVAIFVTPYMLRCLGKSGYGLYMLIGAFVGYLAVMDFGMNNAMIRYVARYRVRDDKKAEQNFLSSAMMTYLGISCLAFIIGIIAYWHLEDIFGASLTIGEISDARIMFLLFLFNVIITLPGGAFDAVLSAYERFSFLKTIEIVRFAVRTILLVVLLWLGYKAVAIVVLDTALNVLFFLVKILYVFFPLRIRFTLFHFDKKLMVEVFAQSFWIVCSLVLIQLYFRIGQIVLGITDGTSAVAVFSIAMIIVGYYGSFSYVFNNLLLPHAIRVVEQGASSKDFTDLMIKVGRLQFLLSSYVLGGFIIFGYSFIHLWVGKDYTRSWLIALVIMIPNTLMVTRTIGETIQQALNRFVFRAFYFLVLVVASVGVGLIARSYVDGPLAMGIGMMIASILGSVLMNFYYSIVIKIDMLRFYKEVFLIPSSPLIISCVLGGIMTFLFPVNTWLSLILEAAVFSLLFGISAWFMGMNSYEKGLCIDAFAGLKRRLPIVSSAS